MTDDLTTDQLHEISLWHGDDRSTIVVGSVVIEYTRRIHEYESKADYQTLITELRTYGMGAALRVLAHVEARGARVATERACCECGETFQLADPVRWPKQIRCKWCQVASDF